MIRRPPRSTRTYTLFPYTTLFRSIIFRGTLIRDQYGLRAALPWFRKALAIDRNNVPALGEYAATLGEIGRTRQMLALTRKMIALDPGNPRAFFMQAAMAARARNYDLARKLLQRNGGRMDGVPAVMLITGVPHYEGGNYPLASERFDRLRSLQPIKLKGRALRGAARSEGRR